MTKKEFRDRTLEALAQDIAAGKLIPDYDQMADYLHEIEGSESPQVLEDRLRVRVSQLKEGPQTHTEKEDPGTTDTETNGESNDNQGQNILEKTLDWAYEQAISGVGFLDSATELAEEHKGKNDSLIEDVNDLIRWQNVNAGTTSFVTGVSGALAAPVTIPADLAAVSVIQIRMVAAIAHMGGYDIKNEKVKTIALICVFGGNAAEETIKQAGRFGLLFGRELISDISSQALKRAYRNALQKFAAQAGGKSAARLIPILGGIVNGGLSATMTNMIGNIARNTFVGPDLDDDEEVPFWKFWR